MLQKTTLSKEEYASVKDARIAQASLQEIVELHASADGINIKH
jgi:hypothetical protein